MTPKEKAEELFIQYRFALSIPGAPLGESKDMIAKQCALIAAEMCEKALAFANTDESYAPEHRLNYWHAVIEELKQI